VAPTVMPTRAPTVAATMDTSSEQRPLWIFGHLAISSNGEITPALLEAIVKAEVETVVRTDLKQDITSSTSTSPAASPSNSSSSAKGSGAIDALGGRMLENIRDERESDSVANCSSNIEPMNFTFGFALSNGVHFGTQLCEHINTQGFIDRLQSRISNSTGLACVWARKPFECVDTANAAADQLIFNTAETPGPPATRTKSDHAMSSGSLVIVLAVAASCCCLIFAVALCRRGQTKGQDEQLSCHQVDLETGASALPRADKLEVSALDGENDIKTDVATNDVEARIVDL